ncbi:MAG: hypothetical protein ABMB14_23420 [Myxococcota bacterium]
MDDGVRAVERTVARARVRLRLRAMVRAGAIGVHLGAAAAIAAIVAARLIALPWPMALAMAAVAGSVPLALATAVGWLRRGLDRRSVALLVDRLGATDELVLTALHVSVPGGPDDPNRASILGRVASNRLPDPRVLFPIRVPRHLRWTAAELVVAAVALFAVPPAVDLPRWLGGPPDPVEAEAERLEQRIDAAGDDGAALPDTLRREVDDTVRDLADGDLSPAEAERRLAELQDRVAAFEKSLAPSADLLDDLAKAARALDAEATDALGQALEDGDLDRAADAARDLSTSLSEASPAERARAAESLKDAGEALRQSADPSLQRAGEAMEQAGEELASNPSAGSPSGSPSAGTPSPESPPGSEGSQGSEGSGGLTPAQAQELGEQLAQAKALGEKLASDRKALEQSQQLNGALEGSRQRLGGSPQVADGSMSGSPNDGQTGDGEGAPGPGDGTGPTGDGRNGQGVGQDGQGASVGTGHTWEDQGESGSSAATSGAEGRQSDRKGGTHVDDFQKLYEGLRLKGAESLLAGVEGRIDEQGRIDQLPVRITTGDEDAAAATVTLPAQYREAATEAIESEVIPPAYEQAVKQYFDAMN